MPLKSQEVASFKKRLLELRDQINRTLQGAAKAVVEPGESRGYSQHQADEGTDDFVKNIHLEVSNKEMTVLRQIERALQKIDEDTYGICDLTGAEIPLKRLEAIPYAIMTVHAQDQLEKGLIE